MPSSSCFIWKPPFVTERWRVFTQLPPVWLWIIETTTGDSMSTVKVTSTQSKPVEWSQLGQPRAAVQRLPPAQMP